MDFVSSGSRTENLAADSCCSAQIGLDIRHLANFGHSWHSDGATSSKQLVNDRKKSLYDSSALGR